MTGLFFSPVFCVTTFIEVEDSRTPIRSDAIHYKQIEKSKKKLLSPLRSNNVETKLSCL